MNMHELPQQQNESNKNREEEIMHKTIRRKIATVFDNFEIGEDRIENLISESDDLFQKIEDSEGVKMQLKACASIGNKNEFIERVAAVLKPCLNFLVTQTDLMINSKRRQLNAMLAYEINDDAVCLHVFTGGLEGRLSEFVEGLQELAKEVKNNEAITTIEAVSWIVVKHPKVLARLGFVLDGGEDDLSKKLTLSNGIEYAKAHMDKDDFLKKYLLDEKMGAIKNISNNE